MSLKENVFMSLMTIKRLVLLPVFVLLELDEDLLFVPFNIGTDTYFTILCHVL